MWNVDPFELEARDLFTREYHRLAPQHGVQATCPAMWVLHDFLCAVAAEPARPVSDLIPQMRRTLSEQNFSDNGDNVIDPADEADLDRQVRALVAALEKVREHARREGRWSAAPMSEYMCG